MYEWAVVEAGGQVCDRYATEAEARAELPSYPQGCRVERVPDPTGEV